MIPREVEVEVEKEVERERYISVAGGWPTTWRVLNSAVICLHTAPYYNI